MSQSRLNEEEKIENQGWDLLLGGLSIETIASTNWVDDEDEHFLNIGKKKNRHEFQSAVVHNKNYHDNSFVRNLKYINIEDDSFGDHQLQNKEIFQRAFSVSSDGQILKPPVVRILDCSENKGNILIATKHIPKGSVIFTERALEGVQIPTSFPFYTATNANTTDNFLSCTIRACQNCFKSLEPASSISSSLPFSELWPVPEYHDEYDYPKSSESKQCFTKEINSFDRHSNDLFIYAKSGKIICRDCGAVFCNRYCLQHYLQRIGNCCRCMRAIKGLVRAVRKRDASYDESNNGIEKFSLSIVGDIDPVLLLATRIFIAQVQCYRNHKIDQDYCNKCSSKILFDGLCGDAEDIRAPGFDTSMNGLTDDDDDNNHIGIDSRQLPLQHEYEAIADAIELMEAERNDDNSTLSLQQFQKIVAIVQRNAVMLNTGSPFRTYYQALLRNTGGRGSEKQQKAVSDLAKILGSKDGKLRRDMDKMIEGKCVVAIGGLFALTAQMNHSCDPNAEIRSQEYVDCNIDVVAKKEIQRGEEICISYIDLGPNPNYYCAIARNRRRRILASRYLFHCQCSRCSIKI